MKKIMTVCLIGAAFTLSACAQTDTSADYTYETQAPYSSERTVGDKTERTMKTRSAEKMFNAEQRK